MLPPPPPPLSSSSFGVAAVNTIAAVASFHATDFSAKVRVISHNANLIDSLSFLEFISRLEEKFFRWTEKQTISVGSESKAALREL